MVACKGRREVGMVRSERVGKHKQEKVPQQLGWGYRREQGEREKKVAGKWQCSPEKEQSERDRREGGRDWPGRGNRVSGDKVKEGGGRSLDGWG